jgi:pimeloyl-ACP methyl ester carboxylesterase
MRTSILFFLTIMNTIVYGQSDFKGGYVKINELQMYYEIHGQGQPLVLLHGGGSTIGTTFGRVISNFAKNRKIIAVELQAHGHTRDIDRPLSFEHDADDVSALLKQLNIEQADFIGFSNGGSIAMQVAIRHPRQVRKLIVCSSFFKREGIYPQVWKFINEGTLDSMPRELKEAFLAINNDKDALKGMHDRDRQRMIDYEDWSDEQIRSINAETLILIGDADVVKPEHAVEMYRLIPKARLAVIPGGHGEYLGEITTYKPNSNKPEFFVELTNEFLK